MADHHSPLSPDSGRPFSVRELERLPKWGAYALLERVVARLAPVLDACRSGGELWSKLGDRAIEQIHSHAEVLSDARTKAGLSVWNENEPDSDTHLKLTKNVSIHRWLQTWIGV